jgi:endonuclease/exonuclease/phosphatase family metal-dependent hydrolase
MTYNIRCGHCDDNNSNSWESRKEILLSVIKKTNSDIIGFQEVIPLQWEYLKNELPNYNSFGTGRDADGNGEGCYIFYKKNLFEIDSTNSGTKWYSSTPDVKGSNDMGDLYNRVITFARFKIINTNKFFYHFNTHLTYLDSLQIRYVNFLSNVIKKRDIHDPFILTGDFNADEKSEAINILKQNFISEKLVDSYREINPNIAISTFNYFTGKKDYRKIDYIFIESERIRVIQAGCDSTVVKGKYPSDHNSVNAIIEFK